MLQSLKQDIEQLQSQIDLVAIERAQLRQIEEHNSKVDMFTTRYENPGSMIEELKRIEMFSRKGEHFMPEQREDIDETMERFLLANFDDLEPMEQEMLTERLYYRHEASTHHENTIKMYEKLQQQMYLSDRHGLDYNKLFFNYDGGYDMERLKTVLKRTKQDREDGVHPFVDPA